MNFRKLEIYRANLDPVVGSEQGKSRPVLIVSENLINDLLNSINIVPITSRRNNRQVYPNEVLIPKRIYGLENESIVLCHQIRTIDKKRLSLKYGSINKSEIQNEVLEAISFQLGIE